MHTISDNKLLMLRPGEIVPPANGCRKHFDNYELILLAQSISVNGIIHPLSVYKGEDGSYHLISGERRLKAAIMAGLRRVPCVLHKTDQATAALFALIENLQRSQLHFFEQAQAIEDAIAKNGISPAEAAARLGMTQNALSDKLSVLGIDGVIKQKITEAGLSERQVYAVLKLPFSAREAAVGYIIEKGLSESQTEMYVSEILKPAAPEKTEVAQKPVRKSAIGDVRLFSNSLTKLVDTIKSSGIEANIKRTENERYIEYKVRIKKDAPPSQTATQLKIC
ncbi:MAG: ParB/RepB/Spo0J family partition protein [Clostridia bacterium]|nr:ParB/RepB/Spo0J family partition protein [Clostridia bacterium]